MHMHRKPHLLISLLQFLMEFFLLVTSISNRNLNSCWLLHRAQEVFKGLPNYFMLEDTVCVLRPEAC
jgi:hypothetical protein